MSMSPSRHSEHELEKLSRLARANRTEVEAIKALQLAGQPVDRWRVFKLQRSIKAQARMEKDLQRRALKDGQ